MMRLFEMSDAQLEHARQTIEDRMYRDYYHEDDPDPKCRYCTHYCDHLCERWNDDEDSDDYGEYYVEVDPDDDACENFDPIEDDFPYDD